MKKLAALMTAAMVMTVGGVYATWTYAESNTALTTAKNYSLVFTEKEIVTASGTLTIAAKKGGDLVMTIDQYGANHADATAEQNYLAELVFSDSIVITYTPIKEMADAYENGIHCQWNFVCKSGETVVDIADARFDDLKVDGVTKETENLKIFNKFDTSTFDIYPFDTIGEVKKWDKNVEGDKVTFVYEITEEMLKDLIKLNSFKIETPVEHTAFGNVISALGQVSVHVSEVLPTP